MAAIQRAAFLAAMVRQPRRIVLRSRHRPITTVVAGVSLLVAACAAPAPSAIPAVRSGGTLRVAIVGGGVEAPDGPAFVDPSAFINSPLMRCCLTRTLLSYNGRPTAQGGAVLRPDLASEMPTISADGLSWTFHVRPNLRYAPPLAKRAIEARDFVTALEHTMKVGESPFYDDIVGAQAFRDRKVDTIAGIQAADATTLVIRLVKPAGDLGNRVALPAMAPVPAEALEGREATEYRGFLIASGPYMYESSGSLELTNPAAAPIWARADPNRAVLVRNPSWNAGTDPLRPAHPDRIEVVVVPDSQAGAALVDSGAVDLLGEPAPAEQAERYLANETLRGRVFVQPTTRVQYLALNLAQPPFDDVHVRRAANLVVNRASASAAYGKDREVLVRVAHHAFPDLLENNLLLDYAPYRSTSDEGDLEAAFDEMRKSKYDANGDGLCDAAACKGIATFGSPPVNASISKDLAKIGVRLAPPRDVDPSDPRAHIAAAFSGWGADYLSAGNFIGLFTVGTGDGPVLALSLMGASADQLKRWGYAITEVPQLDAKLDACQNAVGSAAFTCWAELDQLVNERVVPWVPIAFVTHAWVYSARVAEFSPDQDSISPALDQIRLRPDR